jgi:hypothetical protein
MLAGARRKITQKAQQSITESRKIHTTTWLFFSQAAGTLPVLKRAVAARTIERTLPPF